MKPFFRHILFILCSILISIPIYACEIRVGNTYDLKQPLEEIKTEFENTHQGCFVNLLTIDQAELYKISKDNYPRVDVIIWDNYCILQNLAKSGFLNIKTLQKIAQDKLCIVVKKSIVMRPFMLYPQTAVVKGLLIANPRQTSLGKYTKEALSKLGLWQKLPSKLILFDNNEYIANTVRRGNFDGGIMYCSCAQNSFVQITDILNPKLYSGIIYASSITTKSSVDKDIVEFNKFLLSKKVTNILKKYHLK